MALQNYKLLRSLFQSKSLEQTQLSLRWISRRKPPPGKPPCLPPSKIKRYVVKNPPWRAPKDVKELLWRRNIYNTTLKSLRNYFAQSLSVESGGIHISQLQKEEEEFNQRLQENEEHNLRASEQRLIKETEKLGEIENELTMRIAEMEESTAEMTEKCTRQVQDAIKRSADFITKENMEEKILECLENPVDYNFAVDINGAKYVAETGPAKYIEAIPPARRIYTKTIPIVKTNRAQN